MSKMQKKILKKQTNKKQFKQNQIMRMSKIIKKYKDMKKS